MVPSILGSKRICTRSDLHVAAHGCRAGPKQRSAAAVREPVEASEDGERPQFPRPAMDLAIPMAVTSPRQVDGPIRRRAAGFGPHPNAKRR